MPLSDRTQNACCSSWTKSKNPRRLDQPQRAPEADVDAERVDLRRSSRMKGADHRQLVQSATEATARRPDREAARGSTFSARCSVTRKYSLARGRGAQDVVRSSIRSSLKSITSSNRVAGHEDPVPFDALPDQVRRGALGVGQQHGAAVIDDPAIDLLRDAVVVAAVAGFHVVDGNAEAPRDRSPTARCWCRRGSGADRAGACAAATSLCSRICPICAAGRRRAQLHRFVRRPHAELVEEQPAEAIVVVLAGVDQDVLDG